MRYTDIPTTARPAAIEALQPVVVDVPAEAVFATQATQATLSA